MPNKSYKNRRSKNRRQKGGNGATGANPIPSYTPSSAGSASAFGVQAYGVIGQQSAIPGSNVIDVKPVSNCGGGKKKRSKSHKKTCKRRK